MPHLGLTPSAAHRNPDHQHPFPIPFTISALTKATESPPLSKPQQRPCSFPPFSVAFQGKMITTTTQQLTSSFKRKKTSLFLQVTTRSSAAHHQISTAWQRQATKKPSCSQGQLPWKGRAPLPHLLHAPTPYVPSTFLAFPCLSLYSGSGGSHFKNYPDRKCIPPRAGYSFMHIKLPSRPQGNVSKATSFHARKKKKDMYFGSWKEWVWKNSFWQQLSVRQVQKRKRLAQSLRYQNEESKIQTLSFNSWFQNYLLSYHKIGPTHLPLLILSYQKGRCGWCCSPNLHHNKAQGWDSLVTWAHISRESFLPSWCSLHQLSTWARQFSCMLTAFPTLNVLIILTHQKLYQASFKRAELPPQAATAKLCQAASGNHHLLQPCQLEHHCSLPPPPAKGCTRQITDKI